MDRVGWQLLWWGLNPIIYHVGKECSTARGLVPGNKMREAKQTDILRLDELCMRYLASIPDTFDGPQFFYMIRFYLLVIFKSLVLFCRSNEAPLAYKGLRHVISASSIHLQLFASVTIYYLPLMSFDLI